MLRGWAHEVKDENAAPPSLAEATRRSYVQNPGSSSDDGATTTPRAKWNSRTEFLLATIGNCVGVGNVWRFPYLCYRNGGGSFLIPYFAALLLVGVPAFMLELALGQRFQRGATHCYLRLHRRLAGVGIAGTGMAFATLVYYQTILAWSLVYAFHSFQSPLPWKRTDAERFWEHGVLRESDGFEEYFGVPSTTELSMALIFSWVALFLATRRGVHSAGKAAYVFATLPYAILTLLVIRGSLLEGAGEGIKFYLRPRIDRLGHVRTWLDAFNQIIYSLGIGTGQMVAYGSYTESNEDIVLDAGCISLLNSFTSLYAGVAVFAMLGHKANKDGSSVADVVQSGEGLAFVAIPDGLSELPAAGLWCFIFFAMLFALALDSSIAMLESWTTMLRDFGWEGDPNAPAFKSVKWFRRQDALVGSSCAVGCLISGIFVSRPGIYWFALWDAYVVWAVFIVVGIECVGVAYGYGAAKFSEEVQKGAGRAVPRFIQMCWSFVTPFLCAVLAVASFAALCAGGGRYEGARATPAALVLGFLLMLGPVAVMVAGARDDCVKRPGRPRSVELAMSSPKRTRQMV